MVGKESNGWREYLDSLLPFAKKKMAPLIGCLELTPFCNFECNMCYIRLDPCQAKKYGRLLSKEEWVEIAKQAANSGTLCLELTGGEIFSRSDFQYIYESIYDLGIFIALRTNGYLLDDKYISMLQKRKPLFVSITLYGASDNTYYEICRVEDGFSCVTKNIKKLMDAGINVRVTMTVTRDNEKDQKSVRSWANERKLPFAAYAGLLKPFENTNRSVDDKRIVLINRHNELITEEYDVIDDSLLSGHNDSLEAFSKCKCYGSTFCISWNGKIKVCNTMNSIYEDLYENDFNFQMAYNKMYQKLSLIKKPDKCLSCRYEAYCPSCPAKLDAETGNPEQLCERICSEARYVYTKRKLLEKSNVELNSKVK